jgi:uncharacterized protein YegP (UPF0339 family)
MKNAGGKFELWLSDTGKWYFHLKARNGKVVHASQGYKSRQGALVGIHAIKRIAADAEVVELV